MLIVPAGYGATTEPEDRKGGIVERLSPGLVDKKDEIRGFETDRTGVRNDSMGRRSRVHWGDG